MTARAKQTPAEVTARVMAACQFLKESGFEDVAGLLARAELVGRHAGLKPRKRKVRLVNPLTGHAIPGGAFWKEIEKE